MPTDHTEKGFEQAVEAHLLSRGYAQGDPRHFDPKLGFDPVTLAGFLADTQKAEWGKLAAYYGADAPAKVAGVVARNLDDRGTLDCLRHGVTDRGVKLRLAYFKPASSKNPDALARYAKNVLTVTRQVHYSTKDQNVSVDLVLGLNGLSLATAELKNPFTGQTVHDAVRQYREDRDPKEPLFRWKSRAVVHFAVDPDEVYMTTRLEGKASTFLPFNKGRDGGRGNPDNPASGWKSAYLWEEVWERDSWMDILGGFLQLVTRKVRQGDKLEAKEALVMPRYHQLDAVRKLVAAAAVEGPGKNYLVQHSAGSGKSNTIGWLTHRLAGLHDAADEPVFDTVVVVTDRRNLDDQLRDTVYQFDHASGVVHKVEKDSAELAKALRSGARIVTTTLQKFKFIVERMRDAPDRRYAVVVDEAHSSQTGESAAGLRRALAAKDGEEGPAEDAEDLVLAAAEARGPQKNVSFFAFTATPKGKTLQLFWRPGPDSLPRPFHLYSMRQAVEEGFIHDVLKGYCTYKTYYRLTKAVEDDPELDRARAVQAAARYLRMHPHNLAQKVEVMVEHFRAHTRHKIGGRAKAMVVTSGREHAVRYKLALDKYLAERGYSDVRALVAFSGDIMVDGVEYTEPGMNALSEESLPWQFGSDRYQVLIVAEKYQTGFDEPLLHTMFVDKRLDGLQAVQTLSRLNRTCAGKEDTFVLDFVNEAEDIRTAFMPYFEATEVEQTAEPHQLYQLMHRLNDYQVYWAPEVEDFARVFFKPAAQQTAKDRGDLHKFVNPAVGRFDALPAETRAEFRHQLGTYVRLYTFLSQVVDFADPDLERLYAFGRLLLPKLKADTGGSPVELDEEVRLAFYRLSKTYEGSVSLTAGETAPVKGPTEVGTGRPKEPDVARLSEIVGVLNERFGTNLGPADQLLFEQAMQDMTADPELAEQARANPVEQFRFAFDPKAMDALVSRVERNAEVAGLLLTNAEARTLALELMLLDVYRRLRETPQAEVGAK